MNLKKGIIYDRELFLNLDDYKLYDQVVYKNGSIKYKPVKGYDKNKDYSKIRLYFDKNKRIYLHRVIYKILNPSFDISDINNIITFKDDNNKNNHHPDNLVLKSRFLNFDDEKKIKENENKKFVKKRISPEQDFKKWINYERGKIKKRNNIVLNF